MRKFIGSMAGLIVLLALTVVTPTAAQVKAVAFKGGIPNFTGEVWEGKWHGNAAYCRRIVWLTQTRIEFSIGDETCSKSSLRSTEVSGVRITPKGDRRYHITFKTGTFFTSSRTGNRIGENQYLTVNLQSKTVRGKGHYGNNWGRIARPVSYTRSRR